jgi:hypothetical protein
VIASFNRDLKPFAHKLAKELSARLRPASEQARRQNEKTRAAAIARALENMRVHAAEFAAKHKVGLLKRLLITRAFQQEMAEQGFDHSFIRDATLVLIRGLTPGRK